MNAIHIGDPVLSGVEHGEDMLQRKVGVFAYIDSETGENTTCTLADTWYPISGTFVNSPIEGFTLVSGDPSLQWDGAETAYFEIDWHVSMSCDNSNSTVHLGILIWDGDSWNEVPATMGTYVKNAGQLYTLSGTVVIQLLQNNKIQLVIRSNNAGGVITIFHYNTTIRPFFGDEVGI